MSAYGEGRYRTARMDGLLIQRSATKRNLPLRDWELRDGDGETLRARTH